MPDRAVPQSKAPFLANERKSLETTIVGKRHRLVWKRGTAKFVAAYAHACGIRINFALHLAIRLCLAYLPGTKTVGPSSADT